MYKLVTDHGRWAMRKIGGDGYLYIFSNVVWLSEKKDIYKYDLIEEDSYEKIPIEGDIEDYLVKED